jgi:D-sedoheptulose 7-phosphate isomerase
MAAPDPTAFLEGELDKHRVALAALGSPEPVARMSVIADLLWRCLGAGGKVMFCGNGGSAADAQHLAAELVGRQNYDRAPAAGIALTVDTSGLTAIANDYGYDSVFERQVLALGRPGDVLVGLSTSGRSTNVTRALEAAGRVGVRTVAFTGPDPRDHAVADVVLAVPARETAQIQELHMTAAHAVFALVERTLFPVEGAAP